MLLTGTNTLEAATNSLLEKTTAIFTITLGKDGTLLGYNKGTSVVESIPVKPVDTTGAGDAFVGAVLYQLGMMAKDEITLLSKLQWQHLIANANKAGARTCEYMGAMEAFKHLSNTIFE